MRLMGANPGHVLDRGRRRGLHHSKTCVDTTSTTNTRGEIVVVSGHKNDDNLIIGTHAQTDLCLSCIIVPDRANPLG